MFIVAYSFAGCRPPGVPWPLETAQGQAIVEGKGQCLTCHSVAAWEAASRPR